MSTPALISHPFRCFTLADCPTCHDEYRRNLITIVGWGLAQHYSRLMFARQRQKMVRERGAGEGASIQILHDICYM